MFVPEKLYNCVFGLTPDFQFNVWLAGWWYVEKKKEKPAVLRISLLCGR